ncbi:MAG: ribosomal-processing cysteine protease Prp [Clostridia bacterium]|nr:ribosomal-processing cysteine protease Prp [Clostridia bacterium]
MIRATFYRAGGVLSGFEISGHSGLSQAGSDILCAAVSAMTQLVVNTLTDQFGTKIALKTDPESAFVSVRIVDAGSGCADALMRGFRNELELLCGEYPENLSLREENITERKLSC